MLNNCTIYWNFGFSKASERAWRLKNPDLSFSRASGRAQRLKNTVNYEDVGFSMASGRARRLKNHESYSDWCFGERPEAEKSFKL